MSLQMRKEVHRALVTDLTKATQGRVTLDKGLPRGQLITLTIEQALARVQP